MNLAQLGMFLFNNPLLTLTVLAILAAVASGMVIAQHPRIGAGLRNASYFGLLTAGLLTVGELAGHNQTSDAAYWLDRPRQASIDGNETVITKRVDGHFWVVAKLNGVPTSFLIDTGATYTGISRGVAGAAGITPDEGDEGRVLDTANGPIVARIGTASTLQFGAIEAHHLKVAIAPDRETQTNVIGMNLLSRLASWRVEGNRMILIPRSA